VTPLPKLLPFTIRVPASLRAGCADILDNPEGPEDNCSGKRKQRTDKQPEDDSDDDLESESRRPPPKKRDKGKKAKQTKLKAKWTKSTALVAEPPTAALDSSQESAQMDPPLKKKRGRPQKAVTEDNTEKKRRFRVSVFVEVQKELLLVKGRTHRGNKYVPQEPWMMGPGALTHKVKWAGFLDLVAELSQAQKENISISGMAWWWNKGSSKATLPLTNEEGYQTMLQQIKASKMGDAGVIVVSMPKPKARASDIPVSLASH
jgi:hypothetical protein